MNLLKKLLLKPKCLYCNRNSQELLCKSCINQIQNIPEQSCKLCKSTKIENNICLECTERPRLFNKLITLGVYNGILKNSIYRLKYEAEKEYAKALGQLLAIELKSNLDIKIDYITSIPLHKDKLKERGFNQAEIIAKNVSYHYQGNYLEIFKRVIHTKAQHSLTLREREENLKEAFEIDTNKQLKNKNIILVDDIFTTGTTINETCKLLATNGVKNIYIATVARSLI